MDLIPRAAYDHIQQRWEQSVQEKTSLSRWTDAGLGAPPKTQRTRSKTSRVTKPDIDAITLRQDGVWVHTKTGRPILTIQAFCGEALVFWRDFANGDGSRPKDAFYSSFTEAFHGVLQEDIRTFLIYLGEELCGEDTDYPRPVDRRIKHQTAAHGRKMSKRPRTSSSRALDVQLSRESQSGTNSSSTPIVHSVQERVISVNGEHTVPLPLDTSSRSRTASATLSIPHLIPDAFDNWHNRGIEAIMPRLMTIEEASQESTMKAMWRNGLPRLSRQVLQDEVTELIGKITSQTILNIRNKTATIRTGDFEEKGNLNLQQQYMGRSLYQINLPSSEMKTQEPCTISNVMVPEARDLFPDDWRSQNSILVQFPDSGLSFNVSPAGTFTDFHADSCTIGRAVCFGRCIKGWLCFPPTAKNLCLWQDGLGMPGKCAKYGRKLEGGIFVRTGNDPLSAGNCIDMSSGTIHCVVTIEGGVLGGVNYSVSEALLLSSRMICMQFRRWQQDEQITEDVKWWKHSFTKCLSQADDKLYPVAWYSLVLLLNEVELRPARAGHKAYKEIRTAEKASWTQWQKIHTGQDRRLHCVCGTAYDHWQSHYTPEVCPAVVFGIEISL